MGDAKNERVIRGDGVAIPAKDPAFDSITCFDPDDMKTLIENIDRVKRNQHRALELAQERCSPGTVKAIMKSMELVPEKP